MVLLRFAKHSFSRTAHNYNTMSSPRVSCSSKRIWLLFSHVLVNELNALIMGCHGPISLLLSPNILEQFSISWYQPCPHLIPIWYTYVALLLSHTQTRVLSFLQCIVNVFPVWLMPFFTHLHTPLKTLSFISVCPSIAVPPSAQLTSVFSSGKTLWHCEQGFPDSLLAFPHDLVCVQFENLVKDISILQLDPPDPWMYITNSQSHGQFLSYTD